MNWSFQGHSRRLAMMRQAEGSRISTGPIAWHGQGQSFRDGLQSQESPAGGVHEHRCEAQVPRRLWDAGGRALQQRMPQGHRRWRGGWQRRGVHRRVAGAEGQAGTPAGHAVWTPMPVGRAAAQLLEVTNRDVRTRVTESGNALPHPKTPTEEGDLCAEHGLTHRRVQPEGSYRNWSKKEQASKEL